MGSVYFLVFFVLCSVVQAHSAGDRNKSQNCPKSFICGKLGSIGYPFTNQSCPRSDWLSVSDCDQETHKIQFHERGRAYGFVNISQSDIVLINDPELKESLAHKSCSYFEDMEDLILHNTSHVSFRVDGGLSMVKCNHTAPSPPFPSNILQVNCSDYGYSVYYSSDSDSKALPGHCSVIKLGANLTARNGSDLFSLLSAKFSLQLVISPDCASCLHFGGECEHDSKGSLHCARGNGKFLKLGLGLGLGIGCAFIVAISMFLSIRSCSKQKRLSPEYIFRDNSSSDPSTSDLEERTVHYGVQVFLYNELEEATNRFRESNEIGDGGFGAVYYGKLKDGREVAVKRLYEHNYKRLEQFINEIQILTRLRHKNLVSLYGCTSRRARELLLVYEFIPNGTLASHLHIGVQSGRSMAWPVRLNIAIETASALAYLHASDIIHRDVKTDNILLDKSFGVKVADFGLSRLFPVAATHVSTAPQGTPGYVDPEYHQCYRLTDKSDVYSFGVVLVELISSMPAVDINRHGNEINLASLAVNRIRAGDFHGLVDPSLGFDSDNVVRTMIVLVGELAFRCLQQDKEARPDMLEVWENLRAIQSGESLDSVRVKVTCTELSGDCSGAVKTKMRSGESLDSVKVRVSCTELSEMPGDCSGAVKTETRSGECLDSVKVRVSCTELSGDCSGAVKTETPMRSPGICDEIGLLKGTRPPDSPNSVTERWLSSSTAKTNPSM